LSEQLQGTPALIIPTIKAKLVKTLLANYAMWPLAHIINFKFIPSSQRILYINCVQVKIAAELQRLCVCLSSAVLSTQSLAALRPVLCLFVGHLECLSVQHVVQSLNSFCWNCPQTARTGRLYGSSKLTLLTRGLLMQGLMSVIWFCCISEVVWVFGSCLLVICTFHWHFCMTLTLVAPMTQYLQT